MSIQVNVKSKVSNKIKYFSRKSYVGERGTFLNTSNFYFLLPISRESIALGSNFRIGDFDGFTPFEVP